MFKYLIKSLMQLADKTSRKIILGSLLIAISLFVFLWTGIAYVIIDLSVFHFQWLENIIDLLGGLAVGIISWILFPGVFSSVVLLFLDRIAVNVEKRYYPSLPPAHAPSIVLSIQASLKFFLTFLILNIALLGVLLLVPLFFPFVFFLVNGYLVGREYLEIVAQRRLSNDHIKDIRKTHGVRLLVTGVLIFALMTIPIINLVMPIVATSLMVHMCEEWRTTDLA